MKANIIATQIIEGRRVDLNLFSFAPKFAGFIWEIGPRRSNLSDKFSSVAVVVTNLPVVKDLAVQFTVPYPWIRITIVFSATNCNRNLGGDCKFDSSNKYHLCNCPQSKVDMQETRHPANNIQKIFPAGDSRVFSGLLGKPSRRLFPYAKC